MTLRIPLCALLAILLFTPSPSLAVRGIDAQESPQRETCSELLREGQRVRLTLTDARDVLGRITYVDADGLGLLPADSDVPEAASYINKEQIVSLRLEQPRFPRPGSSLSGFAIGTLAGLLIAITDEPDYGDDGSAGPLPGALGRSTTVVFGAATGLAIGTALPFISPGERDIACAWSGPKQIERSSVRTPWQLPPGASRLRFGGGISASRGYTNYDSNVFDEIRYGGGISIEWRASARLAARSGVKWVPKGTGLDSAIPEVTEMSLQLNYVAVPLGMVYRPVRDVPLGLAAGCEFGRLIDARLRSFDINDGEREIDLTEDSETWDIGLTGGIVIPIRSFEIELNHTRGLRDVRSLYGLKTRALSLACSLWFG